MKLFFFIFYILFINNICCAQIITTVVGTGIAGYSGDNSSAMLCQIGYGTAGPFDSYGNMYICDGSNHCIRKVSINGIITTIAGTGIAGYNGDNILAINAQINAPNFIAIDYNNNIYISDNGNHRIRKIYYASGIITTIAGTGIVGYNGDNIYGPQQISFDGSGNLIFADLLNYRVRKINFTNGIISTIAGTGVVGYNGDNIPANTASIHNVYGLAVDASDNIYLADGGNSRVRKIDNNGIITTIAGTGVPGNSGNNVLATSAQLGSPFALTLDLNNNLFIADNGVHTVRKVNLSTNIITTIAGTGVAGYSGDNSLSTSAQLYHPLGVSCDVCGNVYIADNSNARVRKVWLGTTTIPSSSITVSPNDTVCAGVTVTFTATPANAGTAPTYQWLKNSIVIVGATNTTYSYIPNDGDSVQCIVVSSVPCAGPALSNAIHLTISNPTQPTISIVANPTGAICSGTSVTYMAMITNGGTTPNYQWFKNGTIVGTSSNTYTYTPNNNDSIRCVLTSSIACTTPVSSNMVNMTVNPIVTPIMSISASPTGAVCAGASVTYTATITNGGTTPAYQWQKNGLNVGTNSATYTYTPANGDQIKCILTSSIACATLVSSNTINMTVNPTVTPTIAITANPTGAVCSGTSVTYSAAITNGGTTPIYQWIKNGSNVGTNSSTYTYIPNNGDSVRCMLTSNATCASPAIVSSNTINMTVNPIVTPTITVASSPTGTICTGGTASYTANITNGGTTPSYQWIKNGSNVGANSSIYSYIPNNGDSVRCVLTSSLACTVPVSSSTIYMTVNSTVTPTIAITPNPTGAICAGTSVTYTATQTGGGSTPAYQWIKNGANAGANSNTFTYIPNNGDSIRCVLTSNATCASPAVVSSNTINMTVNPNIVPTLTITVSPNDTLCADSLATFTATATNAGSNPMYQWIKNGSNTSTNSTTYSYLPTNGDSVRCVLTSNALCAVPTQMSSNSINMVINPNVIASLTIVGDTNVQTGVPTTYNAVTNVTGASYQWQVDGVNVGTNSSTFIYTPATTDAVISCYITVPSNSCAFPSFATTKVTVHIVTVGVSTIGKSSLYDVYPNPANDELHVDNVKSSISYQLQNIVGMTVQQGTFTQEKNMLQLQDIPAGMYLLQLTNTQGQREVVRVVKE